MKNLDAGAGPRRPWLFLLLLAWPVVLVTPTGSSMSDSVLLAAIRLVDARTWTLSDEEDPRVVFQTEAFDISVRDRRVYSGVGPGASVLAAPVYLALKPLLARFDETVVANRRFLGYYMQHRRLFAMPGAGRLKDVYLLQIALAWLVAAPLLASLAVRLWGRAREHGLEAGPAAAVALSVALGSMALCYSATYSRPAVAYGLAWHAVLFLLGRPARPRPGTGVSLAAGTFLGVAVATDYASAILVALSVVFLLPRLPAPSRVAVVVPLVAALGATAWYHQAVFGSPFATPYHFRFWFTPEAVAGRGIDLRPFGDNPALRAHVPDLGVMLQLCFGGYKGLFVYSPLLLLGLAGHLVGLRQPGRRRLHVYCLAVFLAYLTFNATLGAGESDPERARLVWGGLSVLWGPRHLYAVIPFLAAGLLSLDWRRPAVRALTHALLAASCAVGVLGAMFSDVMMSTYALGPELRSPLAFVLGLTRAHGPRVPLLASHGVGPPVQWTVVIVLAALTLVVVRREARPRPVD